MRFLFSVSLLLVFLAAGCAASSSTEEIENLSYATATASISQTTAESTATTANRTPVRATIVAPTLGIDSSGCMSPVQTFSYQTGDAPNEIGNAVYQNKVLPPQEWQRAAHILDASELVLVQSRSDETVFWIDTGSGGLLRYNVEGLKWGEGTLLPGPAEGLGTFHLFLDQENNVFGARYNKLDHGDSAALLNRYNEQSNQWEPVKIDLASQDELGISHVEVDEQGIFWLLIRDGVENQLYSLDPKTMTTQHHLAEYVHLDTSFTISHNTLFILAASSDPNPRYLLLQYPLEGGEVKVDYVGEPIYHSYQRTSYGTSPVFLFVDGQQRVWIGGRGWLDLLTGEWHYVIPDPVFITVVSGAGKWAWGEPTITAETPDGRLWYNALRGTGWVDPQVGKWCVFTNYQSNVLPDSYGNLWLIADDGLYMRKK